MTSIHNYRPDEAQQLMLHRSSSPDFLDTSLKWRRLFAEAWGTFLLVLVAAGGGYVALAGLWAAPISAVRSLAPDLVRGDFDTTWIYVAGPVLGALIGVAFEWILKGKPSAAGAMAAQGSLGFEDSTTPEK